jgi:hypothetical protein
MSMPPKPPEAGAVRDHPVCCTLLRRAWGIAPWWAWATAGLVQVAIALPFWLHSSPAPFHDAHGDVYRGWPLVYGLDQGDVIGDDWGPFTAYFDLARFALDTAAAVACGLPAIVLVLWVGRWFRGVG